MRGQKFNQLIFAQRYIKKYHKNQDFSQQKTVKIKRRTKKFYVLFFQFNIQQPTTALTKGSKTEKNLLIFGHC